MIKKELMPRSNDLPGQSTPVWLEREVSILMLLPHPRLVKFLGAGLTGEFPTVVNPGVFPSPVVQGKSVFRNEDQVLFTVQEYMTGGRYMSRSLSMHPSQSTHASWP